MPELFGGNPYPSPEHLRYGFTARHVRCDCCQRDYLPQHAHMQTHRPVGWWLCDNCRFYGRRRYEVPEGSLVEPHVRSVHRYRNTRHENVKRALGIV